MTETCPDCEREFDTPQAMNSHRGLAHDNPWDDIDRLKEMYYDMRMSTYEIADELGCARPAVSRRLRKTGVNFRNDAEQVQNYELRNPDVYIGRHPAGYEQVEHRWDGKRYRFLLHRLLAVAKYGFEEVCDSYVHHKNGVKWDNRPENIGLFDSHKEHSEHHWNTDWSDR